MKSAGLWVNYRNNNGALHLNAHSNVTVRWPFKTEHSAIKVDVTCVTLPYFRDSRYNVTRVTMFGTLWFSVKRPNMWFSCVTISPSTIRMERIKRYYYNNFQCQLSIIYVYIEKHSHIHYSRTLHYHTS